MCLSVAVKLLSCVCLLQWSYCHLSVCCSEVIAMCLSVAVKALLCVCLLQ